MGLGEPQHRLFLCAGLLLGCLLLQVHFGDARTQNNDDLTFDALSHGGRSSRSVEHVHSKSSQDGVADDDHWISGSLHRIKRGLFDWFTTTTEAPPEEEEEKEENNEVGPAPISSNSQEGQSQTQLEGGSDEELEPVEEEEDGYDQLAFGSQNSRETRPLDNDENDDEDEVYNSGHHSGESNLDDNMVHHPTYYRIWFTLMEPYSDQWSPDEYKRTSEQIVDNIDQLYKDFGGNQTSTVVQIKGRPEDMFTSLVTVDLQSVNFNNALAIRKKIEDQINNYNVIGSLHVKPDDFRFLEFEGKPTKVCSSDELECKNAQCVPISARCNTVSDCADGTDEENCPVLPNEVSNEVDIDLGEDELDPLGHSTEENPAESGRSSTAHPGNRCRGDDSLPCGQNPTVFICADQECDGQPDCPNEEDEDPEKCGYAKPCAVGELSCDIRRCIPENQRCDGHFDCEDKTDEQNCPAIACQSDQFRCDDGQCIDNSQRCDSRPDCSRGEDEYNCPPPTHIRCSSTQFQCGDGTCIPSTQRCDSRQDCNDGSDERRCPCPTDQFRCDNGVCIPEALRCDGTNNCQDRSDERNCEQYNRTTHGKCAHYQRRCHDGMCIDQILFCNGHADCADRSDELNCCQSDQLRCSNGTCLSIDKKCNGVSECEHGEDEENCVKCTDKQFRCLSGECIAFGYYCDDHKDCSDGSDESLCDGHTWLRCNETEFRCWDNATCIKLNEFCDGHDDCNDGSDEKNCKEYVAGSFFDLPKETPPAKPKDTTNANETTTKLLNETDKGGCSDTEFECAAGFCIEDYKRCNQIRDCPSGNDELDCPTEPEHPGHIGCSEPEHFLCTTGQCIDIMYRCDNYTDCYDESDELNCVGTVQPTPPSCRYRCNNGWCADHAIVCDGIFDCEDGTDESNCGVCAPHQFKCRAGDCIDERQRCDGRRDCSDASDEEGCVHQCPSDQFRCGNGLCLNRQMVCDGYADCSDQSDEDNCIHSCSSDEYQCDDKTCVRDDYRCDGHPDCPDGSDERGCSTDCTDSEFKCADDECIPSERKCDGVRDCQNGLDEHDCPVIIQQCPPGNHRCADGTCIHPSNICNGYLDCADGSDEQDCGGCASNQFECRDGDCIPGYLHCNGRPDCRDGSDEHQCPTPAPPHEPEDPHRPPPHHCPPGQRPCRSSRACYPEGRHCDHRVDCPDGSDEDNCFDERQCNHEEFRCENGPCIAMSLVCNGRADCPFDASDEADCSQNYYNDTTNGLDLRTYPSKQEIKESREVVFQCRDEGPMRAKVRWTRGDGLPLPPGSRDINGRLEMPNIQRNHSGTYICSAIGIPAHTPGAQITVHLEVNPYVAPTTRPITACGLYQATCANGECIDKHLVCNGYEDCSDGSDETRCNAHGCEPNEFRCPNKRCVLKTWVCDSDDDCGDGGDEVNCGERQPGQACSPVQFACKSGNQCIPRSFHCDSNNDCNDGSDEIGCMPVNIMKPPPPMMHLEIGQTFEITCTAVGIPVPEIIWRLNWGHIPEKCHTTSVNGVGTLTCPNIQESDQGAYSCEGINIKGSILAVPDTILVVNPPTGVCPSGFFNSEARNPSECISCFCFGVTSECRSANLFTYHLPPPFDAHKALGVRIDPHSGVVDIRDEPIYKGAEPRLTPVPGLNGVRAQLPRGELLQPNVIPYFALPENYHGSQLKSYGGYLQYQLSYEGHGRPINAPDVILLGNGYTLLHIGNDHQAGVREEVNVRFFFGEWVIRSESRPETLATREEIMMALAAVDNILIKLQYSEGHLDTSINKIEMDSAGIRNTGLGNASFVEECICPRGHSGLSCEICDAGYQRHRNGPWLGHCNQEVETCAAGYYGDPSRGIPCQVCPCPLSDPANQFATTCSLDSDGEVTCHCPPEYSGRRCERCSHGYTGNPLLPGDYCKPATSHCNVDGSTGMDAYGQCQCKINTMGPTCNQCKNNTFHLAADNQFGCVSCFCMGITEQCISSNWYRDSISAAFTRSKQEFKLVELNHIRSQIEDGIILDTNAREITYSNFRRPDVYYWSLPPRFLGNKISSYGGNLRYSLRYVPTPGGLSSKNNAPDVQLISSNHITLTYFAREQPPPNTVQSLSVPLLEQYWQRGDGQKIDRENFMMALADVESILIKATYTTSTREAALQSVSLDIADERNTGKEKAMAVEQCYCPVGYKGLSCEDCDVGYTRAIGGIYLGTCEVCHCNGLSNECDPETGECFNCRDYTTGQNCETCLPGYEGDPSNRIPCRYTGGGGQTSVCQCDPNGSISNDCFGGVCQCKTNVEGPNCDRCREGTFGLNGSIAEGCQSCFCSGVATDCRESNLYITQIPSQILDDDTHGFTLTDSAQTQRISSSFELNIQSNEIGFTFRPSMNQRLYWSLPRQFTGPKITSYGGKLEFTQRFTQRPDAIYQRDQDVIINGHGINIFWTNPNHLHPNFANKISVTLSPTANWQRIDHRSAPRPASREDILKVLANVNSILIRAHLSTDTASSYISDVTMDTTFDQNLGQPRATNVEVCSCPRHYSGTSCESCALGYYREFNDLGAGPLGSCNKCPCNNNERSCHYDYDSANVICECREGFGGRQCEHYLVPTERPPIDENPITPTITVQISQPTLLIQEIGQTVTYTCSASSTVNNDVRLNWSRANGNLPNRAIDDRRGRLVITNLQVTDSGTYICQAEDGVSIVEEKVNLYVGGNEPTTPYARVHPQYLNVTEGEPIEIRCEASGNPTPQLEWARVSRDRLSSLHYQNGVFRIDHASKHDQGEYECVARNHMGTHSARAVVAVRSSLEPSIQPIITPNQLFGTAGEPFTLHCEAGGAERGTISWNKERGQISYNHRNEDGILIVNNAQPEDSGIYICSAMTAQGAIGRAYANVTITHRSTSSAPTVRIAQQNEKVHQGSDVEIRCEYTGSPTPTVRWTKVSEPLPDYINPSDPVLRLRNVQVNDRGLYSCSAQNALGFAQANVLLEVDRREPPRIEIYPNGTQSVTPGDRIMLHCRSIGGIPSPEVRWSRVDNRPISVQTSGGTISITNVRHEDAGEYQCTAENEAGRVSAIASVVVLDPPTVYIDPPQRQLNVQRGEYVRLECRGNGNPQPSVEWIEHTRRDQGLRGMPSLYDRPRHTNYAIKEITSVTEQDEGIYICVGRANDREAEERIELIVHNDIPVRGDITDEDPGGTGETRLKDNELPRPVQNETFMVPTGTRAQLRCNFKMTDDEPIHTTWIRIGGKPLSPSFYLENGTLIADNVQPSDAGEYNCLGRSTNSNKTLFRVIAILKVLTIPKIRLHPSRQVVRPGGDATIECTATGDQPIDITWSGHNRELSNNVIISGGLMQFRGIQLSDAGMYRCRATNPVGEADSVAEVIVQEDHLAPNTDKVQEANVGDTFTLTCNLGVSDYVYWYKAEGDLPVTHEQTGPYGEQLKIINASQADSGHYYCTSSTPGAGREFVTLVVHAKKDVTRPFKPDLDIHASNPTPRAGENVEVYCKSNEPGVIVSWTKLNGRKAENVKINGGQLIFTSIRPVNNGVYRCEARGYEGFYHKDHFVDVTEEATNDEMIIKRISEGSTVTLDCKSQLDAPVTFTWSKDKGMLPKNVNVHSNSIQLINVGGNDAGTYICTSSNPHKKIQARNVLLVEGIVPYFAQAPSSFIELATLPDAYLQFTLEVSFKPEDHDGLILYDGSKQNATDGDFISLALRNGIPEFKFNMGQNTSTTVAGERPLTMREWHTVKIIRNRRKATMYVDGEGPYTGIAASKYSGLTLREPLYLGGVPSFDQISPMVGTNRGLVGCIASFKIGHALLDITKEAHMKKGITNCETCSENPCDNRGVCQEALTKEGFMCICPAGFSGPTCNKYGAESCNAHTCGVGTCTETDDSYQCKCPIGRVGRNCERTIEIIEPAFSKNAYIAYPTPNQVRRLKISMKIKPRDVSDGLIAYCGETDEGHGDFLSLTVKDRHVEFRFDVGNGPVVIRSENEVKPNKWVIITASRSANDGRLIVNGDNAVVGKSTGIHRALQLRTPFYIGGYDTEKIKLNQGIEVNEGFNGCITEVSVSSLDIDPINTALDAANVQDCSTMDDDFTNDNDIDNIDSFNDVRRYDMRQTGCSSGPCRNDGTCYPLSPVEYKCSCINGYTGEDCEIPPNQCDYLRPCQNHGTCQGTTSQYICNCPLGYTGTNCEHQSTIRNDANFNGNGYIEFNKNMLEHSDDEEEEVIALELSTNSSNGLIFFQGQGQFERTADDYIALAVVNGYLEFSYDLGMGPAVIRNEKVRVDDGFRHRVILKRQGRSGSIEVDGDFEEKGEAPGITNQMNTNGNIYLGGTPNNRDVTRDRFTENFKGCIHGFELQDSNVLDLGLAAMSGVNVKACYRHSWIPSSLIFTDSDQFDEIIPPPPVNIIHPKPSSTSAAMPMRRRLTQCLSCLSVALLLL